MKETKPDFNRIRSKVAERIAELSSRNLKIETKSDQSLVTEFDLFINALIKSELDLADSKNCFYSEEDNKGLEFPAYILDPLDGTKEFVEGRNEYSISLAFMKTPELQNQENWGWLYNPGTQENFFNGRSLNSKKDGFLGFVSRTEFEMGLHNYESEKLKLKPIGSIAYKLGLLSQGKCDFVYSKKPKNLWDICAGTLLCLQAEISLFHKKQELQKLDKEFYDGPLLWCKKENFEKIISLIS